MISILFRIWLSIVSLGVKLGSQLADFQKALQSLADGQKAMAAQLAAISDILIPGPVDRLVFTAHLDDGTILNEVTNMIYATIRKCFDDSAGGQKGKPALVDGVPTWASSDETVITVESAADGMSATVFGVAPNADPAVPARVVVTADADLGSGVTPLTGSLDFVVTGGSAASITISAADPANQ